MSLTFITMTGCDEGMQMTKPIMPEITDPGEKDPMNTGEIKQPESGDTGQKDNGSEPGEQEPGGPEPTLVIEAVNSKEDGSVTVSGTSTNLAAEETITITLGDTVTVTTTTNKTGAWSATVPAKKTARLSPGTIAVKATAKKAAAESSFEIAPPSEPTLTIDNVVPADDGSVTVSGDSANLPAEEVVTITLGDTVTVTATTDSEGTWTATVPATEAADLAAGTTTVTATAKKATADSSFEYTPPQPEPEEDMSLSAEEVDRIQREIIAEVIDSDDKYFEIKTNRIIEKYGALFDMGTDVGRDAFKRFAEYEEKVRTLYTYSPSVPFPPRKKGLNCWTNGLKRHMAYLPNTPIG